MTLQRAVVCLLTLVGVLGASADAAAGGIFAERWVRIRGDATTTFAHRAVAPLADDVAAMSEAAHAEITEWFGWDTRRVAVGLEDRTDGANGYASVVPRNAIRLFAVPPATDSSLGYHDNYMWNLIVHEMVHIVHISRVSGLPRIPNLVLDTEFAPNQAVPRWFTEGLAVWFESELTGSGRLNSALFDAHWRATALGGAFPDIGDLSGDPIEWPFGTSPYLYGGHFLAYLIDTYGFDGVVAFIDRYGRQVLPFRMNELARDTIGVGFVDAWPAFRAHMEARAAATAASQAALGGPTWERVSAGGNRSRFVAETPEGGLAYLRNDAASRLEIVFDGDTRPPVPVEADGEFDFIDARRVVIDQPHTIDAHYAFRDVYLLDLETGDTTPLTWGARAREPRVDRAGERVVFAAAGLGATHIDVVSLATGERERVFESGRWEQATGPVFDDDGGVVFALQRPGEGRDLYRVAPDGTLTRLTADRASATDPFVAGDTLLFSSDRAGVHDIYSLELETGALCRLTAVPTGAFAPRWVDDTLVGAVVGPTGFDVVRFPEVRRDAMRCLADVAEADIKHLPASDVPLAVVASEARLGPPIAGIQPPDVAFGGAFATTGSHVALRAAIIDGAGANRFDVSLRLLFGDGVEPVGTFAWTTERTPVPLSLSVSRALVERQDRMLAESRLIPFVEEQYRASAGFSVPFATLGATHRLSFSYAANLYRFRDEPRVTHHPVDIEPVTPTFTRFNALSIGWSWSDTERYARSFTTERGSRAATALRLRSPVLGAEVHSAELTAAVSHYRRLPGWRHVLALRVAGGIAEARGVGRRQFTLGGPVPQDVFVALWESTPANNSTLRGYRPGARTGDRFVRAQTEYRVPLLDIGKGVGTLPVLVRRLYLAVFFDVGLAAPDRVALDDGMFGAGAELRLSSILGYTQAADLRLGFARGTGRDGIWDVYFLYGFPF